MERSILQTLCYYDIFDYPLTLSEIGKFLMGMPNVKCQNSQSKTGPPLAEKLQIKIQKLIKEGKIEKKREFYFLQGREKIVAIRKRREKHSQRKLLIAKKVARFLHLIPTIKMVAVTGALAVNNAKEDDDIDFLIVTVGDRLWLTRMQAVLLIELFASRPQLSEGKLKDTVCLNIFLDENHLKMPKEKQNLFVAHELVQMKPLWQKDKMYQKFLRENQWVKKFLPNWRN